MSDSFSLDSRAVLGLLAKAHQVFASDEVQLAFPLRNPVSWDAAELAAALGPAPDGPAHTILAEFSAMMNWVPDGPVWPPVAPGQLDDIVRFVLTQGMWASGDRTPEEEARFTEARALVSMTNPVMQDYLALKDAWIRSKEQARNNADDDAAQEAERRAEAALVAYPQRDQIEQAMDDLVALDARAPYRTREAMLKQIDMGIGTFNNPSVGDFSPVRPIPKEVIQAENWDRVSLDKAALEALAASAPQELLDRLVVPDEEDPTVSITFEYASAQVHRQWLDERLFELRCWQFSDEDRVLSDGGTPPSGDCPSYVRAIVLARNVVVTKKAPPGGTPPVPPDAPEPSSMELILPNASRLELIRSLVKERGTVIDDRYLVPVRLDPTVRFPTADIVEPVPDPVPDPAPDPVVEPLFVTLVEPVALVDPVAVAEPVAEPVASPTRFSRLSRLSRLGLRASDVAVQPEPVTLVGGRDLSDLIVEEAQAAPDFPLVFQPTILLPDPVPVEEPGLVTETTPPGQVILLALICKNIGRSPDPNPSFDWTP